MQKLYTYKNGFSEAFRHLRTQLEPIELWFRSKDKISAVENVIERIYHHHDDALCEFTEKFDNVRLSSDNIAVSKDELKAAYEQIERSMIDSIQLAIENVTKYQQHIKVYQQDVLKQAGVELRTWYQPIERVGICVPGASAPLPSTVIMSAVPAKVAGVKEIAIVSPPRHKGSIHPLILACCYMLDITEVYRIGGAQAVAALAIGTETIKPVHKIVGPGNIYVQLAKKILFGAVDIDSFAGPSEIVVLADEAANPKFVAADLLGQAEHDPGSGILVTDSESLAQAVEREIDNLLKELPRAEQAKRCLEEYGALIIADNIDSAIDVVNKLAPEHLSIQTENFEQTISKCKTAGAIFAGPYTSEALGDYVAGPSHVLPTGGTAKFFSPLNVMDFIRHTSVIRYDKDALAKVYPAIKNFTEAEQLIAHQKSASIRLE